MRHKGQLFLFFVAVACIATGTGVHESIFNNFLAETHQLSAGKRGLLEFPRELPGLLVALMAGLLCLLSETRMGMIGALMFCAGMVGLSQFGGQFTPMVACMVLGSMGMHLLMPVGSSLAVALSTESTRGRRLGQMSAMGTAGMLLGSAFIWLVLEKDGSLYKTGFMAVGVAAAAGAWVFGRMNLPSLNKPKARLVLRRKFWLYYVLEFIYGARKQIFITFGPWVLVRVYGLQPAHIARLLFISACCGLIVKPLAGMLIDRIGEKKVLVADGILLFFVCLGYGYALKATGNVSLALWVASACYVVDDMLFSLSTARTVYASRLADSPQELTSTLSMGVSINHISSMIIPIFAGALWLAVGYEMVFLAAAGLALLLSSVSRLVPAKVLVAFEEAEEAIEETEEAVA